MKLFLPPNFLNIDDIGVVDDSPTGTKDRIAWGVTKQSLCKKYVYATTPDGASPGALAEACHEHNIQLTLLSTKTADGKLTAVFEKAQSLGAKIEMIPAAFDHIQQLAKNRAVETGAEVFDFDSDLAIDIVADYARSLGINPGQVYSASARGAMARGYQKAWPLAEHFSIVVLENVPDANFGISKLVKAPPYSPDVILDTPFPCNAFYEARGWEVTRLVADRSKNPFFMNPAGPN